MIKLVALLKRRQGMSSEEFMTYYESHHAKLAEKTLRGNVVRYFRRYLNPLAHPLSGAVDSPRYDAIVEMWFQSPARMQEAMALLAAPGVAEVLAADEKRLFDTAQTLVFTVEERGSDFGGDRSAGGSPPH
jgi:uncharacterized protein (TIGR02118 family)